MKKLLTSSAAVLFVAAQVGAWPVLECGSGLEAGWAAYERSVRTAKPGTSLYLPKPFPKTRDEVVEDYLYQYRSIWSDTPAGQLPLDERSVFQAIQQNTARFVVLSVENWTTMRCNRQQRDASYHLIRIFGASGTELARTTLAESGFIVVTSNSTEEERSRPVAEQTSRIMKLDEALATVKAKFKVLGSGGQYVATFGTLRCRPFSPCVAFKDGADSYILTPGGELFRLRGNGRRLSLTKELKTPEGKSVVLQSLGPTERLVSLGGATFGIAQAVERVSGE